MRDPVSDHLLTSQNSALVIIDHQPSQIQTVTSIDQHLVTDNVVSVGRLAKTFNLPVVARRSAPTAEDRRRPSPSSKTVLDGDAEISTPCPTSS
jgi:nicotinamidase-related amidase